MIANITKYKTIDMYISNDTNVIMKNKVNSIM